MMMKLSKNMSIAAAVMAAVLSSGAMWAQEGPTNTQMLVTIDSKDPVVPSAANLKLELNGRVTPVSSFERVAPNGTQIAILIDDGLRFSVGSDLDLLRKFIIGMPAGTQVMVGYMSNGRVTSSTPFTTDHEAVAGSIRLPFGRVGLSGSPYFCLSDFVQRWGAAEAQAPAVQRKARFVLMVTNGVDLYNGSTSVMNQDSPYVQKAIDDAQRAGVGVSSIYYGDAGIRGRSANFSGQSYLAQIADATGGRSYYQGTGNPVSLAPFIEEFQHDLSETFVATFQADAGASGKPQLVRTKLTSTPKLKLRHPDAIRPGNHESAQ
jgi:hypothetical protein